MWKSQLRRNVRTEARGLLQFHRPWLLLQKGGGMTTQNARTKARTIAIKAYRAHVVDLLVQSSDCNTPFLASSKSQHDHAEISQRVAVLQPSKTEMLDDKSPRVVRSIPNRG
ncbi:hypothetical protein CCHR01_13688 [Colletotrichum chrysophilum]|uniref:Uncharacterized protein n=1 Tax=Colletotrichum chrysophilum TaxID=1836956 RepID=A0AAD9EA94_9PEZI|nr:hypothetical protein CCHR01_13688 [Colletotrichum chrysophilum]